MNEVIESIRSGLYSAGELTELILNALSLLTIILGVILSLLRSNQERSVNMRPHPVIPSFGEILEAGWLLRWNSN